MEFAERHHSAAGGRSSRIITVRVPDSRAATLLCLTVGDLLAGLSVAVVLRAIAGPSATTPWLLAGFLGFYAAVVALGLYPGRGIFGPERIRLRALASLIAFLPPALVSGLWTGMWAADLLQCVAFGLGVFLLSAFFETAIINLLVSADLWQVDVIVVGDPSATKNVQTDLTLFPDMGLRPATQQPARSEPETVNLHARKDRRETREYMVESSAPLPTLYSVKQASVTSRPGGGVQMLIKRAIDFLAALFLIILTSPVLIFTGLLIAAYDGKPIIFKQTRGGKDGTDFQVWKFRSMYKDAPARLNSVLASDPALQEEWSRFFKLRKDPRILPVIGNFIRRTSIDELPQLWNVLKGEMSLVGPRPFPHNHLDAFSADFQRIRHRVLPGITGLWQVTLRSDGDLEMQERLDTAYVQGWSLWLDLYILFRTPIVLLSSRGAR